MAGVLVLLAALTLTPCALASPEPWDQATTGVDADADAAAADAEASESDADAASPDTEAMPATVLVAAPTPPPAAHAGTEKVVALLNDLKAKIESEGAAEQKSYDKYACWVEATLQRKSENINSAKAKITELGQTILKLSAEVASHAAEVEQLNKDIAKNQAGTSEATSIRQKENEAFKSEKVQAEQCIESLGSAITTLHGAGVAKSGDAATGFMSLKTTAFNSELKTANLISVAVGLRRVMQSAQAQNYLSDTEADDMKRFIQSPQDFIAHGVSAVQTGQNPFGDYAPASDRIQGILKGMKDSMTAENAKDISEEAERAAEFDALVATKNTELGTMQDTLEVQSASHAAKTKELADSQIMREELQAQQAADESFFEDTKAAAEAKAADWSTRTRLRIEELQGMQGAIEVLQGGKEVFSEAATTFVQMKSVEKHTQLRQAEISSHLRALSEKYQNKKMLQKVELLVKKGGLDSVMSMITKMMALLRKEEQDDIDQRDKCERDENANTNDLTAIQNDIAKADGQLLRMAGKMADLQTQLDATKADIAATNGDLAELLRLRNKESDDFKHGLKLDAQAAELIEKATTVLSKYMKGSSFMQVKKPEYSQDEDKAPTTEFSDRDSHKSESTGIVAILDMMKEDFQKEMQAARTEDARAAEEYKTQNADMTKTLEAQMATKVSLEKDLAAVNEKHTGKTDYKKQKTDDRTSATSLKNTLAKDCAWTHNGQFESRRDKRKSEMGGLVEAQSYIASIESGEAALPPSL